MSAHSDSAAASPASRDLPSTSSSPSNPIQVPLTWPPDGKVDLDWINHLMSAFDWSSKNLPPSDFPSVLPVQAFDSLVLTASKILHKEPNCLTIEPDEDSSAAAEVVVVGDVHGQYHDLLFLLQNAGFPSENRFFVFNGDYVDRGAWGLETFLLLLAWKVYLYLYIYIYNRKICKILTFG
jgi:serine/threonine-protein phosphatase 5